MNNEENKMLVNELWPRESEYDEPMVICPLCEKEVPESAMIYAVCDECLSRNETIENAISYGAHSKATIEINAILAKALTDDQINEALFVAFTNVLREFPHFIQMAIHETVSDDTDDFAHWLIEQK